MNNQKKSKWGGKRANAGRPTKADEVKLIETLTPLAPLAFDALEHGLKEKNPIFVKLWFEYYYGKPQQKIDHTTNGEKLNINPVEFIATKR